MQLQISIPLAADQLVQLADSASPDVWKALLNRTPDAARRALLAQLRARRRRSEGHERSQGSRDQSLQRSQESRDPSLQGSRDQQQTKGSYDQRRSHRPGQRHHQRTGGDLASRLQAVTSSYSGLGVGSSARRAYSTLERDAEGRRRVSSGQSQSPPRHQAQTNRPHLGVANDAGRQSGQPRQPSREYAGPSKSYRPPSGDIRRPTSLQRPPSDASTGLSSSHTADLMSSYSSWKVSPPSSHLHPPPRVSNPAPSNPRAIRRSHPGPPLHGGSPPVTTYRPRREDQVTTYRPRRTESATHRRGRAEVTTYRPAVQDLRALSGQYGPPRQPEDPGHTTHSRHQHGASDYSPGQQQEQHQQEDGLEWLMDVVPGQYGY